MINKVQEITKADITTIWNTMSLLEGGSTEQQKLEAAIIFGHIINSSSFTDAQNIAICDEYVTSVVTGVYSYPNTNNTIFTYYQDLREVFTGNKAVELEEFFGKISEQLPQEDVRGVLAPIIAGIINGINAIDINRTTVDQAVRACIERAFSNENAVEQPQK
ncbi:MAG: hypothetical protein ACHP6I_03495 [Rickettsiales bacterium]